MKNNDKTMIPVAMEDLDRFLVNMSHLLDVHFNLIELFQQEDKLKKHHRPYLHVREQIAETIERTAPIVLDIAAQLCDDMKDTAAKGQAVIDEECGDCPCKDCEAGCWNCANSPCMAEFADLIGDDEEVNDKDEDNADALKSGLTAPTGDYEEYLNAPDGSIVLMKKGDCDTLLNAILMLAEQVRMVTEMRCEDYDFIDKYAKFFPAFAAFEHDRLDVYKDARFEADTIADFIGESDFRCYPMTTVELPN